MDKDVAALLAQAVPFILLIVFWIFMRNQMRGRQGQSLKSLAKRGLASDLDRLLIESEKNVVEPKTNMSVRMLLVSNRTLEGRILWVDPQFIKFQDASNGPQVTVPKSSVVTLEQLSKF